MLSHSRLFLLINILLLLASPSCFTRKNFQDNNNESIGIIKATQQTWHGGIAGSGFGTQYRVYLKVPVNNSYHFDSLWVNGYRLPVNVDYVQNKSANDPDTLQIVCEHKFPPPDLSFMDSNIVAMWQGIKYQKSPSPLKSKGEAVIFYKKNGKDWLYLPVEKFTVLPVANYP